MSDPDAVQPSENGLRAFDALGRFLEEDEWHPQPIEGKTAYRTGFNGVNGQTVCYAQVRVDVEQLLFYVIAPIKAPQEARQAVAEFVARANYGLRIGNFELDFSDGEVRYKSSLDFETVDLTPRLIRNTIYPAVQTMDRYLPGLMAVIYGGKSPADAIGAVEGSFV